MSAIESIANFAQLSPRIASAGQPSMNDFELLADEGFEMIVNLMVEDSSSTTDDEATWVKQLGLSYLAVPVLPDKPDIQDFLRFLNGMNLHQEKHIFVHCVDNKVASVFVCIYLVITEQLNQTEGWNRIQDIWRPNLNWEGFYYECLNQYYSIKSNTDEQRSEH